MIEVENGQVVRVLPGTQGARPSKWIRSALLGFALETTLADKSYARHIPNWHAAGYHVSLVSNKRF